MDDSDDASAERHPVPLAAPSYGKATSSPTPEALFNYSSSDGPTVV